MSAKTVILHGRYRIMWIKSSGWSHLIGTSIEFSHPTSFPAAYSGRERKVWFPSLESWVRVSKSRNRRPCTCDRLNFPHRRTKECT